MFEKKKILFLILKKEIKECGFFSEFVLKKIWLQKEKGNN